MKFIRSDASHSRKSTKLKNNKDRIKNFYQYILITIEIMYFLNIYFIL